MKITRLLSLILAVMMIISVAVAGVSADDETLPYSDVKVGSWSYDSIVYVYENGLMNGTGGESFSPKTPLTRSMVVTVLYRLEGSPRVVFKDHFIDVADRKFYSEAVTWAKEKGIVNATSVNDWGEEWFSPDRNITRQELATLFVRYAQYKYVNTDSNVSLDKFKDASDVAKWASGAMKWANETGLIKGTGNGDTLSPKGEATREQFATIIHRFCDAEFEYIHHFSEPKPLSTYTVPDYPLVEDADIYVAVDGNDNNPGTKDKPLATLEGAKKKVDEIWESAKDGVKVAFMAGNYGSLNNVVFEEKDGGSAEKPITYCAYGDGDVVFSNGILIPQSEFKPIDESEKKLFTAEAQALIYKADLKGKIDEFGFNTRVFTQTGVATEAREPNGRYYSNVTTTVDDHASIQFQQYLPGVVAKYSTFEGMKVTGFLRTGWLIDVFPVKSYDPETGILTFDFENAPFDNGYSLDTFPLMFEGRTDDMIFFSNIPDFLDANNEFWFDNKTSTLYVYNPKGDYAVDKGGTFMTVNKGAEYLSFVGLEFNTTSSNAIVVAADHFTIDMCTICNVGGRAAVNASSGVTNFTVRNSELYNFVDTGILLDTNLNIRELKSGNNVIENNYFHDFTLPQYFSSGIEVTNDVGTKIAHNYFYQGGHGGIRYNSCIDLVIEYNVFDNIMTKTQDFGAVYTYHSTTTRSNHIRYNIFKNIPVYAIYLDNDTCGQKVYGNIFYETLFAIVQNGGRENEIHDNVFLPEGGIISSNTGFYEYIVQGNPDEIVNTEYYQRYVNSKPKEGDPMYEEWLARWPELYSFNIDLEKLGDPECLFTTLTYLSDNVSFGYDINDAAMIQKFGVDKNNRNLPVDENPFFVNPSIGDYSVKDGADFFDIPFEKIGRY